MRASIKVSSAEEAEKLLNAMFAVWKEGSDKDTWRHGSVQLLEEGRKPSERQEKYWLFSVIGMGRSEAFHVYENGSVVALEPD